MLDFITVGAIFLATIAIPFAIRFAHLRNHIRSIQSHIDGSVDDSYEQFVAILHITERKDHYPDQVLSLAAQYNAWKTHQGDLSKLYTQNRFFERFDILGMGFSAVMIAFGFQRYFPFAIEWIYNATLFFVTLGLLAVSICSFLKVYKKMNEIEDRLGFGRPHSTH